MTFENLPDDWPSMSLADPDLAVDVVDLFLGYRDRLRNSALLLLCDESGRAQQPFVISDVDWSAPADERPRMFRLLAGLEIPKVVVAVGSPGGLSTTTALRWRQTALEELAKVDVELLGFYCADSEGVWQPEPIAA